jgi:hypothetical protein
MTVAELIEMLRRAPQDMPVVIANVEFDVLHDPDVREGWIEDYDTKHKGNTYRDVSKLRDLGKERGRLAIIFDF